MTGNTPMLPGTFTGVCNLHVDDTYRTTDGEAFADHMRTAHKRKDHSVPQWQRPNYNRWRGPRVKDDPAKREQLADKAALIPFRDRYVMEEEPPYEARWTYGEAQYWCDSYGKGRIWAVPTAPLPDGALLVQLEKVRHWTEERGWFDEWRRVGAPGSGPPENNSR